MTGRFASGETRSQGQQAAEQPCKPLGREKRSPAQSTTREASGGRKKIKELLVVAFSSLGSGVVRREWGRALKEAARAHRWPEFDTLFVADPAASWYCAGPTGLWRGAQGGAEFYERRVRAVAEAGGYRHVV
mmetsp:Transcript_32552/g.73539  ORF Transcript_32552/g.73539 Transcript_32552/m.73539 type:complete len:132 (-) Transcript_32552:834-1229(-)